MRQKAASRRSSPKSAQLHKPHSHHQQLRRQQSPQNHARHHQKPNTYKTPTKRPKNQNNSHPQTPNHRKPENQRRNHSNQKQSSKPQHATRATRTTRPKTLQLHRKRPLLLRLRSNQCTPTPNHKRRSPRIPRRNHVQLLTPHQSPRQVRHHRPKDPKANPLKRNIRTLQIQRQPTSLTRRLRHTHRQHTSPNTLQTQAIRRRITRNNTTTILITIRELLTASLMRMHILILLPSHPSTIRQATIPTHQRQNQPINRLQNIPKRRPRNKSRNSGPSPIRIQIRPTHTNVHTQRRKITKLAATPV